MNHVDVIFENNDSVVTISLARFLQLLELEKTEAEVETLIRKIASSQ